MAREEGEKPGECDIKIITITREKLLKRKGITENSGKVRLKKPIGMRQ